MRLIIGLGNPGSVYSETRHNVGYVAVDELQKIGLPEGAIIKKSGMYMNLSGDFVGLQVSKYKVKNADIYIIHDDLDIPLGEYKIQFGKGPKDHNGLKSIDDALGTNKYWHVRVGVDNRPGDNRPMGEEYVLQNFPDEEKTVITKAIKEACKKLVILLKNTS